MTKRCALCRRRLPRAAFLPWRESYCGPCFSDYLAYRRAFRREHGRWPTMEEFRRA